MKFYYLDLETRTLHLESCPDHQADPFKRTYIGLHHHSRSALERCKEEGYNIVGACNLCNEKDSSGESKHSLYPL